MEGTGLERRCSRSACAGAAVATLTYVYADQTAVLGPLATYAEPHTYDLCATHAERLMAPRGWATVRLFDGLGDVGADRVGTISGEDDLLAVADAVSKGGRLHRPARVASPAASSAPSFASSPPPAPGRPTGDGAERPGAVETGRRGHLRVLRDH